MKKKPKKANRICQNGAELAFGPNTCGPAIRPDPRFPRLDEGNEVLCEECYQAVLDEMIEEMEGMKE